MNCALFYDNDQSLRLNIFTNWCWANTANPACGTEKLDFCNRGFQKIPRPAL